MYLRILRKLKAYNVSYIVIVFIFLFLILDSPNKFSSNQNQKDKDFKSEYDINNYGDNINLPVLKSRQNETSSNINLKFILFWNEAYGSKEYDIGFGRNPFYWNLCPETRCFTTDNRTLKKVEDFDAILFHQRSLDWNDLPKKRNRKQRYIHYIMESAQYLYTDISTMNNFFNWTMTYRKDSDFYRPYGRVVQIKPLPENLDEYIRSFGAKNQFLAAGKNRTAAWFVSHCATQARRERYVKKLSKYFEDIDIYGRCGRKECPRSDDTDCYAKIEKEYKFYLSFENSLCTDYVTEKFFNVLKYNMVPVTYNGAEMEKFAPRHSYINALDFPSVQELAKYLEKVMKDDALYASYFWWKQFYQVRTSTQDLNQAFCDLCAKLHGQPNGKNDQEQHSNGRIQEQPDTHLQENHLEHNLKNPQELDEKVYTDLYKWWVKQSHCKKFRAL